MKEISSTEAVRSFGDYLSRVRHTGETLLIMKNRQPIATLAPAPGAARQTAGEFLSAWQELKLDAAFADDLEQVGREDQPLDDPWA